MRVALVFKRLSLHGGSERQLVGLARGLGDQGHDVHVFCQSVRIAPPRGVSVHVMPPLPMGSWLGMFAFSRWARSAVRRVEQRGGGFDVRHAFGRTQGQDVYRVGGGCHRTYLEHAHALDRPEWMRRWLRNTPAQRVKARLEERALVGPPAPFVITNSVMVRDDLVDRFALDPQRVTVIRNGVDLERFRLPAVGERAAIRGELGLADDAPLVLFLGTGYARKGLEAVLRALPRVVRRLPGVQLVIAGRDRRAPRWRRLADELGLTDRTHWLGGVSEPERLYRAADVYALPTAYDPAANSTLEALASGIPVVTTTMNGASEVMTSGLHGSVLPTPVAPDELADALTHWLVGHDRVALARRTRGRAEEHDDRGSLEATLDVYRAVLEDRARRQRHTAW